MLYLKTMGRHNKLFYWSYLQDYFYNIVTILVHLRRIIIMTIFNDSYGNRFLLLSN